MTRDADKDKPARPPMQRGGRGVGGPPPNVVYGGQAEVAYVPPAKSGPAARPAPRGTDAPAKAPPTSSAPQKKVPAKPSRYGSVAPGKSLTGAGARIFAGEIVVQLEKPPYGDPDSDWPMYVSVQKLPDSADRGAINGVYIHRSWLPDPPPAKLRLKFEPA